MTEGETDGNAYDYVCAHGTEPDSASRILCKLVLRPTKAGSSEVVATSFYSQATVRHWNREGISCLLDTKCAAPSKPETRRDPHSPWMALLVQCFIDAPAKLNISRLLPTPVLGLFQSTGMTT